METLSVNGVAVVTIDQNNRVKFVQFLPDDEFSPVLEKGCKTCGQLQLLRNAAFDYVPSKPRVRNNALLIRKAKHGRLSGTRDHAIQLTLKVFASEGIDWKRAFIEETVEVLTDLMGPKRMCQILNEIMIRLRIEDVEK